MSWPNVWRRARRRADAARSGRVTDRAASAPTRWRATGVRAPLSASVFSLARCKPRFAEACGTRAKTDAPSADAGADGRPARLAPEPPISAALQELRDLQQARTSLVRDRLRLLQRQQAARLPLLKRLFAARFARPTARSPPSRRRSRPASPPTRTWPSAPILVSVRGLGPCAAVAFIAGMPELGRLPARQAAALAGLAPMTRQSGRWCGKARISGGRHGPRQALHMPALSAIRYNPDMRRLYERLCAAGKPPKVAITAVMRKLVVLANTLIAERRDWQPPPS